MKKLSMMTGLALLAATNFASANSLSTIDLEVGKDLDPFAKLKSHLENKGPEVLSNIEVPENWEPGYMVELVQDYRAENTSPVPVPAAIWLMGSGLLGLLGVSRLRKA